MTADDRRVRPAGNGTDSETTERGGGLRYQSNRLVRVTRRRTHTTGVEVESRLFRQMPAAERLAAKWQVVER